MEMMLTGGAISGTDAANYGFAHRALPADELEFAVMKVADKIAKTPPAIEQTNKPAVPR